MSVSKEAIEAFGQSFWLVNARSKIDANYHEIEAALTAALPHLGSGEAVPVAWESQFGDGKNYLFYAKERAQLQVEVDGKVLFAPSISTRPLPPAV